MRVVFFFYIYSNISSSSVSAFMVVRFLESKSKSFPGHTKHEVGINWIKRGKKNPQFSQASTSCEVALIFIVSQAKRKLVSKILDFSIAQS